MQGLQRAVASVYEANSSHDALRKEMEQDVASSAQSSRPRSSSPPPPSSSTSPPPPPTSNTTTATATATAPDAASRTTPAYTRSTQPQSRLWSLFAWPFGFAWRMTWVILSFACKFKSVYKGMRGVNNYISGTTPLILLRVDSTNNLPTFDHGRRNPLSPSAAGSARSRCAVLA